MRTHLIFLTTAILFVVVFAQGQTPISSASYSSYEPYIAINPTNPRNIVIVAITLLSPHRGIGAWRTTDGGGTLDCQSKGSHGAESNSKAV